MQSTMLHYKRLFLPSNLLFHESKFFITSRKEDIIQPSVFPIPIQEIYDFFAREAGSGETLSHPVAYLCIFIFMHIHTLRFERWTGGVTHPMKKGA